MKGPTAQHRATRTCRQWAVTVAVSVSLLPMTGCKPEATSSHQRSQSPTSSRPEKEAGGMADQLAEARIDAALKCLEEKRPDEALALLVSALKVLPSSSEAREHLSKLLRGTTWNIPSWDTDFGMPVEHVVKTGPDRLLVSLGGKVNTAVQWNLKTQQIESVLFPMTEALTRSVTPAPRSRAVVIERGNATLLCDGKTLKPICELGKIPSTLTPQSSVVFSSDGVLMAHPTLESPDSDAIVWHIRDVATGQIIRSSPPPGKDAVAPLAAFLSLTQLRVIHADGSLSEMPVSPVEEIKITRLPEPVRLLNAKFSSDGNSVLLLQDDGPNQVPLQSIISYTDKDDSSLTPEALLASNSWSTQPNLWNGLLREDPHAPFSVTENQITPVISLHSPLRTRDKLTAFSWAGENVYTGDEKGHLVAHRRFILPASENPSGTEVAITADEIPMIAKLAGIIGGYEFNESSRKYDAWTTDQRFESLDQMDVGKLTGIFPGIDFLKLVGQLKEYRRPAPRADALAILHDRISRGDPRATPEPAAVELVGIMGEGDEKKVMEAIQQADSKGPVLAVALAQALKYEKPEWIAACLAKAENLPPLLRTVSLSRIAWLQNRKADALSPWPDVFPEIADVRLREDWDGWEQANFQPSLDLLKSSVRGEIEAITVPSNSSEEQRKSVLERLQNPETVETLGRNRFADACLKAATAFSEHPEEAEATFQLANLARTLGAPPEPCLRAEALALTGKGNYQEAHASWIQLITEHPVSTHLPGDYAEAAYTAFENLDPDQAMTILTTGMHRFPNDGNFALRAGWVALLTGNSERAYRFLREGQRIGFPEDKHENAVALLVIAAAQSGATDDAGVYYQDLMEIDPAWADSTVLDSLEWPEELKDTLRLYLR